MTKKQLQEDIDFLVNRSLKANKITFGENERDTGASSNSIVAIAYGVEALKYQYFPADICDMNSCERMWNKLPEHRKKGDALRAMEAARDCDYYGKRKVV